MEPNTLHAIVHFSRLQNAYNPTLSRDEANDLYAQQADAYATAREAVSRELRHSVTDDELRDILDLPV